MSRPQKMTRILKIGHELRLRVYADPYIGGTFFDEPVFDVTTDASDYYCRDDACQEIFVRRYRRPMPDTLTQEVIEFKQVTMAEFLQELINTAKETRPNAVTILDVLPRWNDFDYYRAPPTGNSWQV